MLKDIRKPFQYPKLPIDKKEGAKKRAKAKDTKGTLRRIWSYLAERKGLLILVMLMVVISAIFGLLGPFVIGKAIDHFIVGRTVSGLIPVLLLLLVIYIIQSLSLWFQNYWMITISQGTVFRMRSELFTHLHELPIPFFDKQRHGELMSRVTNDIENVSSTLNTSVIQILSSVITFVGTVAVMLYMSPLLTVITLTIIPVMAVSLKWITNRTGKLFKEQQKNLGELNGYIEESVSGAKVIKAYSREKQITAEFLKKNAALKTSGFWAQTISGFIPKVMNSLNNLSFTMIAAIGGLFALKGWISIGSIVVFAEYSRQFTRPLNDLANQFNTMLSAIAGAERVFDVLDEKEEREDEKNAVHQPIQTGSIEFRDVSFGYDEGQQTLKNLQFTVPAGQSIAFVGPTGAGKTTVTNLLARFYEPDEGRILIDGTDIKTLTRASLRKNMGFVLQDSFLFQGTIRENIRYGRLDASDQEVEAAAKTANAHSFIERLPKGYDTVLTQNGSGISQGQKQLISIARAVLADPVLLILDEATSNIDTVTEVNIQEALTRLMEGRTSVIIAHRLNTIQRADQIVVLKDGEMIEKGSHEELILQKGFYSDLYKSQFEK
ncbi:ABC transporter ATP-binding protein [Bacillus inaquosorum]|uniref:ABC transporter ATP-binding protein n=1 Tax=Bacillus inaquosorum TaxID=483913 RepID=UPI000745E079|nr:ABC transporter ATP-binding protein [Bacillus inaquosorum]PPA34297.1 ABC transporter ATP-binding protein [Bacillus subtilis]AMA51514.1 multidrug ABC transporter ATP-binding protein [Bacillus inaquosorum]MBT2191463.1 ABC transporter ATP-binding protein/permease [Bacillus inaquosorum]MBT3117789.1 ABC transporter ATP-binding protein/permease [Bacillus inaquosorum]MBT3121902.1 ABC transporter ATP-binding protein/permease [Bacillus inaquosorum]